MKYIKYLLLGIFMLISFYFTDKIMIYLENQNPIMKQIQEVENKYTETPVNATIKDNTIIPGKKGKKINKRKSLLKMDDFGSFNETFLIYDEIKPEVSLEDNLDKVIIKGNPSKRSVAFVVEDANITKYFDENDIQYTLISNLKSDLKKERDYLLGEEDKKNISDLNSLLNKNKVNSKICLVNYSNIEYCKEKKYYIVAPTIDTGINITQLLSNIGSGSIILVRKNTNLDNLKLILQEIRKQDLEITSLKDLICE
ncbi:MAG: hypothetical protein GX265_00600 [Mollicutes bacterium]|nr:hypothetical protein [Mollicutes bacterium]